MTETIISIKPIEPTRTNPQKLLIFGLPKIGKTTILALLNDCLLLDLENGSDFVKATKVKVNDLKDIYDAGKEILKQNKPFKYIAIDTVTKLEDFVVPLAVKRYTETIQGKNYTGKDVRKLPDGNGYLYFREAFFEVIDYINSLADNVIYIAHTKDKRINRLGEEFSCKEVDLTGKISSLLSASSDAIGYMYRKDNKTLLNFTGNEEILCGSRCKHLRGKNIVIAEEKDDKLISFWNEIYLKT